MKIFKYQLPAKPGPFVIEMPPGQPLSVGVQDGVPVMWAAVEETGTPVKTPFALVWTGFPVPQGFDYVGTYQTPPLVWHLYKA